VPLWLKPDCGIWEAAPGRLGVRMRVHDQGGFGLSPFSR